MQYEIHRGDCIAAMRAMPDNSVDSIVTDPPYELGFMGKSWDASGIAYSVEMWREALRVLKPGGHLLAFSGSRTCHRMTCAIEDAGFEVRDQIMWVYGSGFPKSLDVSKAIDKANGRGLEDWYELGRHIRACRLAKGLTVKAVNAHFGGTALCNHWEAQNQNNAIPPTPEHWAILKDWLGCDPRYDETVDRAGAEREITGQQTKARSTTGASALPTVGGETEYRTWDVTAPATDAARRWEGWGTALKPAHEPICVARKPLSGTVAANVLAHGTGALNIDGCRVATDDKLAGGHSSAGQQMTGGWERPWMSDPAAVAANAERARIATEKAEALGRWPANLIHDGSDEVLALFPDLGKTAGGYKRNAHAEGEWLHAKPEGSHQAGYGDSGSAARFFMECKSGYNDVCPNQNPPPFDALTAALNSSQPSALVPFALVPVVNAALPEGLHCSGLSLAVSTTATASDLKLLCENVMQTIQSIARKCWQGPKPVKLSLSLNPANAVVHLEPTGTTTITITHWRSDGFAEPVTFSITRPSWVAGAKDFAPFTDGKKFIYCAKASKADRGPGNTHPTVKPQALMRYLVRLVTPPGGHVLDPFAGSGSTVVAALSEGMRATGIELLDDHADICEARADTLLYGDIL